MKGLLTKFRKPLLFALALFPSPLSEDIIRGSMAGLK